MEVHQVNIQTGHYNGQEVKSETFISKLRIYAYFALALAITGVVTFFYPYLLESLSKENYERYLNLVYVSITIPTFFILLSGIIMSVSLMSVRIGKKPILMGIFFLLYSISIGMLLGTLLTFLMEDGSRETLTVLLASFLVTSGLFIICGIISGLVKNMNGLFSFLFPFSIGIIVLILVNIFLQSSLISWLTSIFLFLYILGITTYDFHMINRIANRSTLFNKDALAIYCAFSIYTDFIALLIRVAIILLAFAKRN